MTKQSLNDIMNQMAEGHVSFTFCQIDSIKEMSELDAFLRLDETLATLNKEYLDAKSQHEYLIKTFGRDDAMAEVAEDVMDSAWCAMQTRYLEVRAEAALMEQAQQLIREAKQACIDDREKKAKEKYIEQGQRFIVMAKYLERVREMNKPDYLLAAVVLLFGLLRVNNTFFHFRSSFNAYGQNQFAS